MRQRKAQFAQLVDACRGKLHTLYAVPQTSEEMRRAKAKIITDMRRAYADPKTAWGGDASYDKWLGQDMNNAKIFSLNLYTQLVPAFEVLPEKKGRDRSRFYRRVSEFAHLPKAERLAALNGAS